MQLRPATIADFWQHVLARKWQPTEQEYRLTVGETLAGHVWVGVDADGVPAAIGGVLIVDADKPGTCWFDVVPGSGRQMVPTVLLMRRVIRVAASVHQAGVNCFVRDGNTQGQRLAAALGFEPAESALFGGLMREWRLRWER